MLCARVNFRNRTKFVEIAQILIIFFSQIGVNAKWLDQVLGSQNSSNAKYKQILVDRLLQIVHLSGQLSKNRFHFFPFFYFFAESSKKDFFEII